MNQEGIKQRTAVDENGCWIWQNTIDKDGYGRIGRCSQHRSGLAHRVSFELAKGPIPSGLTIDHLCRNRSCVNPDHLEPVTHAENMARSHWPTRTHCEKGHEFTESNSYFPATGGRVCRKCQALRAARYKARKRIAK